MYLLDSKNINQKLKEIFMVHQMNVLLGRDLLLPISEEIVFDNIDEINCFAEHFQQNMKKKGIEYTYDQAMLGSMICSILQDSGSLKAVPPMVLDEMIKESRLFSALDFYDNPYLQNIRFSDQKIGNFKLTHNTYEKFEIFIYDVMKVNEYGVEIPRIGSFKEKFLYPCIMEGNTTWMSITPNEIFTMKQHIEKAHGKVLTLGCGMGYFAYMAALKENVSKVVIVEKSPEVIELFKEYVLPQCSVKDKIEIVHADAFEYMESLEDGVFDYCFADIWKGNTNFEPYLKLKNICKKFSLMETTYWIEESIAEGLINCVYLFILNEYYRFKGREPIDFKKNVQGEALYAFEVIEILLKDVKITKVKELNAIMDYHTIIDMLSNNFLSV